MKEKLRFLGMDVHAETIAAAIAEPDGEVRSLGTIPVLEQRRKQPHQQTRQMRRFDTVTPYQALALIELSRAIHLFGKWPINRLSGNFKPQHLARARLPTSRLFVHVTSALYSASISDSAVGSKRNARSWGVGVLSITRYPTRNRTTAKMMTSPAACISHAQSPPLVS